MVWVILKHSKENTGIGAEVTFNHEEDILESQNFSIGMNLKDHFIPLPHFTDNKTEV